MAEEIAYNVSVDTGEGGKSLKSLKEDFKQAQKELDGLEHGTTQYVKALEKLGGIRDKIGDLNAEINAFNPEGKVKAFGNVVGRLASGFQAAQGAAALFGGENKNIEKTLLKVQAAMAFSEGIKGIMGLKDSFTVLGNVIKANPLMLIATIIVGIGVALYALKDKIGIVGDAFTAIGDAISWVTDKVKEFTDWIGISSFKKDELRESIIKSNEQIQKATSERYDSEIGAAKRAGKETETIEMNKLRAIQRTNQAIIDQIRANSDASDEDKKKADELVEVNKKATQQILDLSDKYHDDINKKNQDEYDRWKKLNDQKTADRKKQVADMAAIDEEVRSAKLKDEADQKAKDEATEEARVNNILNQNNAKIQQAKDDKDREDKAREEKSAQDQAAFSQTLATAEASTKAMGDLSNFLFDLKRSHLVKGSAAELKAAKRQFQVNKALAISSNIISTIVGITNALGAQSVIPEPFGTVLKVATAAAVGISGTVATAKIASQKFEGGGSAGGGGGGMSAPSMPSPPTIAAPSSGLTELNPDGTIKKGGKTQPTVKAIVVETDITKSQKHITSLETRAKL